jgi:hypothetical protein
VSELISVLRQILRDVVSFAQHASGLKLRKYQIQVARAIVDSVINKRGLSFVVIFPRQSGKNELQAQIETYILTMFSRTDAEIVKISPTWKPQTMNAMRRLQRVLERNLITMGKWWKEKWLKEQGYIYRFGNARIFFMSGGPASNIVGATASTLLEVDEAQDVFQAKFDKDISPMAASTNATRVFWGTAWTSRTLLARELRAAREAEKVDGIQRAFVLTAEDVAREAPAYGKFVAEQVAKMGRQHPLVKTQFFSEEIDAEGGMFPPARRALMQGKHEKQEAAQPGFLYALLLDVAGEDEGAVDGDKVHRGESDAGLVNQKRDSTALTVVQVDLSSLSDDLIQAPSYHVVCRYLWTGVKHTTLYGQIKALAEHWEARYLVVDSTGVGAGLASFLGKALGENRVIPYVFTQKSKSDLGWGWLAVIETGRYKEYAVSNPLSAISDPLQAVFWQQIENCQSMVLDGPGKLMRWGVPDGTRDATTGELVHDDLILSAALCAALDGQAWGVAESKIVHALDPIGDLREAY